MDRIKKIKIKQADGSMSDYYPIGADSSNIDFSNGYSLEQITGLINPDENGTIETQLRKAKLDNEEVLYYFNHQNDTTINAGLSELISGECSIIKAYGKIIMIDTGGTNRSESIKQYLTEIGVSKVDYLIISHWHYDHCTNFYSNMNYIDWSNCVCYFPLDNPSWAIQDKSYYSECMSFAKANCKEIIFPVDNDKLILNDNFSIEFFNCGEEAFKEIKQIQEDIEEFAGHSSAYASQYYFNDYSMFALVRHNNVKVLYSGDAMRAGQERVYKHRWVSNVDVYKFHHHAVNSLLEKQNLASMQYRQYINPEHVVVMNGASNCANTHLSLDLCFYNTTNVYTTWTQHCIFSSKQNSLSVVQEGDVARNAGNLKWTYFYIFVDVNNGDDPIRDGSWWHPFKSAAEGVGYSNKLCDNLCDMHIEIIVMPCDTYAVAPNNLNRFEACLNNGLVSFTSYDYYKDSSKFVVNEDGIISDETRALIKKYKISGDLNVEEGDQTYYRGLWLCPKTITTLAFVREGGIMRTKFCIFEIDSSYHSVDLSEVNTQAIRIYDNASAIIEDTEFNNFTTAVTITGANSSAAFVRDSYVRNCTRVITGENHIATVYYGQLASFIKNSTIVKPSYSTLNWMECYNILTDVHYMTDPNATKDFIDDEGNEVNFNEWLLFATHKNWMYRNDSSNGMIIYRNSNRADNYPIILNSANNNSDLKYWDAFGGNFAQRQIGAIPTASSYDLADTDFTDLNDIKTPGVWEVVGSDAAANYANMPTTYNCRVLCLKIGFSYFQQIVIVRDGTTYERFYDSTRGTTGWSNWRQTQTAATWQ